jgi:hypothetical protein
LQGFKPDFSFPCFFPWTREIRSLFGRSADGCGQPSLLMAGIAGAEPDFSFSLRFSLRQGKLIVFSARVDAGSPKAARSFFDCQRAASSNKPNRFMCQPFIAPMRVAKIESSGGCKRIAGHHCATAS